MSSHLLAVGLSNAVVATGLAAIVFAVTRIWRHAPLAHWLWLIVLVKLVTPPLFDLPIPILASKDPVAVPIADEDFETRLVLHDDSHATRFAAQDVGPQEPPNYARGIEGIAIAEDKPNQEAVVETSPAKPSQQAARADSPPAWRSWSVLLLAIWAGGGILVMAAALIRLYQFHRLVRRTVVAPRELQEEVARLAQKTGVRIAPDVRITGARIVPLIFGVGRRCVLLLPASLLPSLSQEERSTILAHELAHLHRRDHWRAWFELVVVSLYWWHPVAWLACRQLRSAADECCDGWVVKWFPDRVVSYAESMLKSLDFIAEGVRPVTVLASGFGQFHSLKRRFEMVLNRRTSFRMTTPLRLAAYSAAALLLLASPLLVLGKAPAPSRSQDPENKQKELPAKSDAGADYSATDEKNAQKAGDAFRFRGRVVSPDGKPVIGAKVFLYQSRNTRSQQLAQSKDNGEFQVDVKPASRLYSRIAQDGGLLVAVADGFGLAVKSAHECETTGALASAFRKRSASSGTSAALAEKLLKRILTNSPTFQLTEDSLPLSGRVIDIQGRPVSGAKIQVCKISDAGRGGLKAWEKAAKAPHANYYSVRRNLGLTVGNDVGGVVLNFITPATTDQKGRFTLKGIGRQRVVKLLVSGPGVETTEVFARTAKGDPIEINKEPRNPGLGKLLYHPASFTHVAGPSQPVIGTVIDTKSKKPLEDVTIQSYQLAGRRIAGWTQGIVRAKTDAMGRFRLEGLPIGSNRILALSPIDEPYIVSGHRARTTSDEPLTLDIELTRGVWIEGRAFDVASGEPIRSGRLGYYAFISNPHAKKVKGFNGAHLSTRYRLNRDGTYRIPGLPGRGIVAVMASRDHDKYQRGAGADKIEGKEDRFNNFRTYPYILSSFNYHILKEVNPAADAQSIKVDFAFSSGKTLQVAVVDADGKPVSGCQYTGKMAFSAWRQATGDQVEIFGYRPEKPRRVQVFHKKRKLVGFMLLKGKQPDKLTVTLQPWAEIKGRIVDASRTPKANVEINDIYNESRNRPDIAVLPPSEGWQVGKYFTDDEGRFHIAGLMPGYKFGLAISENRKEGIGYYLGELRPDEELKPGEVHELGDLKLEKRRRE